MHQLTITALIFSLRIVDVSLGTLRMLYTVRGRRCVAAALGTVEAAVFIFAISRVFKHIDSPLSMIGYAGGFAAGTVLGMTLERWIGSGSLLLRIISRDKSAELRDTLRHAHFGVTSVCGQGRHGDVCILYIVAPRKRTPQILALIEQLDPTAFVTTEPVHTPMGGYLPTAAIQK